MSARHTPADTSVSATPKAHAAEFLHMDLDSGAIVPMVSNGASCWMAEEVNWRASPTDADERRAQLRRDLSLHPHEGGGCEPRDEDEFLLSVADFYVSERG